MFSKRNDFIFSSVLVVLSLVFYHFTSQFDLPSRNIAQVSEKIYRNRVIEPERTIDDVHQLSKFEEVVKLKNARIVIADYDLIRRDFPQVRDLSNPNIDEWILKQVGFISKPQAAQSVVNTQIPTTSEVRQAARPPEYGRALVYPMLDPKDHKTEIGLIDVKGAGSLFPEQMEHGNGVATLGECVREYLYENLVRDVLDDADLTNKTVGSYAVIDAGFGVLHEDGSSSPAGLYLRQAQHRVTNDGAWLDADKRTYLQSVFHRYGIDPNKNIQGTTSDDIFDFGHYVVKDDLPTTDPAKQIPFDIWGYDKSIVGSPYDRWFYSKKDHPWQWSHELADSFASGKATRHDAWTHYENLLKPARAKLTTFREKDYALHGYQSARDVSNFLKRMIIEKDVFVIDNIKFNLLNKGRMNDPVWKNFSSLVQLTKSLELLPFDHEIQKLQNLIAEKALETNLIARNPLPPELESLISKLTKEEKNHMKFNAIKNTAQSCFDMASAILQH
jgi:hypothetical protein